MTVSSILGLIIVGGLMFLMHRSGASGSCCGGHEHGGHEHSGHSTGQKNASSQHSDNKADVDMVRDPICNMWVRRSGSVQRVIGGVSVFFCSEACAEEYMKKLA